MRDPLTQEEREWIRKHDDKIVLAHDPSAKPIDFIDENGQFRGVAADYVELIEKSLNFKFNIVHLKTWDEAMRRAKNKEIDVLCAFSKNPQREKWMLFTEPYIEIPTVILTKKDIKGNLTLDKMKNMKVTFTKGWVIDDFLRNNYSYLDMLPAIDEKTAMNYVSLGQADAWVTALTSASIMIEEHKITNLRTAGETELSFKLAMASRRDWPILNQVLKKGLSLITEEERSDIFNKWIHIKGKSFFYSKQFWVNLTISTGIVLLIIATIITWNLSLRRQVEQRTTELTHELIERKRTEESLRESEEKYRQLFSSESDAIMIFDAETKNFIDVNDSALRLYGYNKEEFLKLRHPDITAEPEESAASIEQVLNGKLDRIPIRYHKKNDGTIFPVEISTSNFTIKNKKVLCGVIKDISERMQAEEEKKQLETQLQQAQKMESIGTLAGGIAHDFNNILSPIMIHSELAMMDLPPDSPIRHSLEQIFKAGERARDMIKQVLAFSRQRQQEKAPIKIGFILKEVIRLLRSSIPTTIDIRHSIETEVDTVFADPTQIHQVLLNLCTNASYDMREKGGALEIELDDLNLDSETVSQFEDLNPGSYLSLTVTDNGHGIDPEVIERIFEPYFTTKDVGEGTGMGLAVVHGIVKSHGGDITVKSELEKGTTFQVLFPKYAEDIPKVSEPTIQLQLGTERILFVDDEKVAVDAIQPMLENFGYTITARTSSIEALEAFRNNPQGFDLVITDQTMPNMTGEDLTKELMSIRSDIPIILCTGFSDQIDEHKAKAMGIRAFVMKPIVMREMANIIRKVLDKK